MKEELGLKSKLVLKLNEIFMWFIRSAEFKKY